MHTKHTKAYRKRKQFKRKSRVSGKYMTPGTIIQNKVPDMRNSLQELLGFLFNKALGRS